MILCCLLVWSMYQTFCHLVHKNQLQRSMNGKLAYKKQLVHHIFCFIPLHQVTIRFDNLLGKHSKIFNFSQTSFIVKGTIHTYPYSVVGVCAFVSMQKNLNIPFIDNCIMKSVQNVISPIQGTLHLVTFIRRDLIWYVSIPEDASLSVRPGSAFRTKGAVATSFMVFGTSFLFVTAHLTAHQEKVKERVGDVKKIVHALDLPKNVPCKNKSKGKGHTSCFSQVLFIKFYS